MSNKESYLIVGGDSRVGRSLAQSLRDAGRKVYTTTRRLGLVNTERLYLDYEDIDCFHLPSDVNHAYIVAAISDYQQCEVDPKSSFINLEKIPALAKVFFGKDIFVTFISTNSVFGGNLPWPNEDDGHFPSIAYAKQKSASEKLIINAANSIGRADLVNIVRITKILDIDTPPIPDWINNWKKDIKVSPFSDLIFSPMSSKFVGSSLAKIGELKINECLHLSGIENINYVEFCIKLAKKLNINFSLIEPTSANEKNIKIAFKPRYSGLGMTKTTVLTGIYPQTIDSVIADLDQQLNY